MARTVNQIAGGRLTVGLGAGWNALDFEKCGLPFRAGGERAAQFQSDVAVVKSSLAEFYPRDSTVPLLIAATGTAMLDTTAQFADGWNASGPSEEWSTRNDFLNSRSRRYGRDPRTIERTVNILHPSELEDAEVYISQGASHFVFMCDLSNGGDILAAALKFRSELQ
jgi:alkanesulfonate monooxygenase SsuD/methylene tetrahydromethanopterin reductase-like flavin-dependent oxidoreductase (luciferase family)